MLARRHALALAHHRRDGRAVRASSLFGMRFVQQQFFPSSDRPELLVDWTLPQNASIAETKAQMDRFEETLAGDPDIDHWSSYVGQGAVRFMLSFDVQPSNPSIGQIVIVTKSIEARERAQGKLQGLARAGLRRHRRLRQPARHRARRSAGRCSTASAGRTSRRCATLAQQLAGDRRRSIPGSATSSSTGTSRPAW